MYVSCQSLHFVVVVVLARRAVLDAQSQSSCDLSPGLSTISTGHHHQLVRFFMHHSSPPLGHKVHQCVAVPHILYSWVAYGVAIGNYTLRSEERRVGKECRTWWWQYHLKKK